MIYIFKFISDKKNKYTDSEFTMTSDTLNQFYSRVLSQYGVPKDKVAIVKEIEDSKIILK